jgi:hypothetical protein
MKNCLKLFKKGGLFVFMFVLLLAMNLVVIFGTLYYPGGVNYVSVTSHIEIRSDEVTITDSSTFSNHYDAVNLGLFNYNTSSLIAQGYVTLGIIFQLDIREVDDGFQEIFIYSGSTTTSIQLVTGITAFEHVPGSKNTTYMRYEFYAEIILSQIIGNTVYIRYGAHGAFNDNWKNKFLEVQLLLSTQTRSVSNLVCTGYGSY